MNIKLITKALHTLSLLSEEDYDLVLKLRALTEDEREQFRTALELQKPAAKKASKKSSASKSETERVFKRCETCGLTKRADVHKDSELGGYHEFREKKSEHAASLNTQLNKRREQGRAGATPTHCYATIDDNGGEMTCGKPEDDPVHDMTYLSSHPFARDARPATTRSPANGGVVSATQSSEASAVNAQAVTAGLSSED